MVLRSFPVILACFLILAGAPLVHAEDQVFRVYAPQVLDLEKAPNETAITPNNETFNESAPGYRNLGQLFTWKRDNASLGEAIVYHATIYDYQITPEYTWWSHSWGRNITDPAPGGNDWLFIYPAVWGEVGESLSAIWGIGQSHFAVWINGKTYYPEKYQEETYNGPSFETSFPLFIWETAEHTTRWGRITNHTVGGSTSTTYPYGYWRDMALGRMYGGESNAWDGWILYQIPKNTSVSDIFVGVNFNSWGNAVWSLGSVVDGSRTYDVSSMEARQLTRSQEEYILKNAVKG